MYMRVDDDAMAIENDTNGSTRTRSPTSDPGATVREKQNLTLMGLIPH